MNSEEYKRVCEQANVFRLHDLNETLIVLRKENALEVASISAAILGCKIEKPPLHKGNHQTDFVAIDSAFGDASAIVDILFDAEACSLQSNVELTSKTSVYVHLVNMWSNYRESLE